MWNIKTFDALTTRELHAIYQARVATFVVEQHCPYQEVDDLDLSSIHLFKREQDSVIAYCRIITKDTTQLHLGRVLIAPSHRDKGLGRILVAQAMTYCKKHFPQSAIHAQAQAHLADFYASFGFQAISDVYLEDGIPHIDMVKNPETQADDARSNKFLQK